MSEMQDASEEARFRAWWNDLTGAADGHPDTAGRAELRRCETLAEMLTIPAFRSLLRRFGAATADWKARRLAVVAHVLSHVRHDHKGHSLMREVGLHGDEAVLSEARLKTLLRIDDQDLDDLRDALRRTVHLAGNTADVGQLGVDILHWNERTRTQWAFDYYQAAEANPFITATTSPEE